MKIDPSLVIHKGWLTLLSTSSSAYELVSDLVNKCNESILYTDTDAVKKILYREFKLKKTALFIPKIANNITPLTFGSYSHLLWASPTMKCMLENLCEFSICLGGSESKLVMTRNMDGDCELIFSDSNNKLTFLGNAFFISVIIRLIEKICPYTKNTLKLYLHDFPFDKSTLFNFEDMLSCEINLHPTYNKIIIKKEHMDRGIESYEPTIYPLLILIMKNWKDKFHSDNLLDNIYSILDSSENLSNITNEHIASELIISVRTLNRRLSKKNTSFRHLLSEYKLSKSLLLLEDNTMTISEIAFHLGFSDISSFSRAFKRWTGFSPTKVSQIKYKKPS